MSTVVMITDGDSWGNPTDIIVLVDPSRRRLLWIPRDLFCVCLHDRVNTAFSRAGHYGMRLALREHGFRVQHSICLKRSACERVLDTIEVCVPIAERMVFRYPLHPRAIMEDGFKEISFDPPEELLKRERIHQWIGARRELESDGSDLRRLERQQILLRSLLETGFDFTPFLSDKKAVKITSRVAVKECSAVSLEWTFETLSGLDEEVVDGKNVLRNPTRASRLPLRLLVQLVKAARFMIRPFVRFKRRLGR